MRQSKGIVRAPDLEKRHIANLKVLIDRSELFAELPQNADVVECGVASGISAEIILQNARPKSLLLVDTWDSERYGVECKKLVLTRFAKEIDSGLIEVRQGYSFDVLAELADNSIDWVHIDTNHSYETTKRELELCRRKLKQGGLIVGHDYSLGNFDKGFRYGVIRAVNEFCLEHNWEMIFLTHEPRRNLTYALREIVATVE